MYVAADLVDGDFGTFYTDIPVKALNRGQRLLKVFQ